MEPGVYRHYKGKMYRVHFTAMHSETMEEVVVYEALYPNEVHTTWVRPKAMFLESVEVDGRLVPRFAKIEEGY